MNKGAGGGLMPEKAVAEFVCKLLSTGLGLSLDSEIQLVQKYGWEAGRFFMDLSESKSTFARLCAGCFYVGGVSYSWC